VGLLAPDEYFTDGGSGLSSPDYSKTRTPIWYGGGAELDAKVSHPYCIQHRPSALPASLFL
jgi:hypothetical protein